MAIGLIENFEDEYSFNIDSKSRLFIPAKYREIIGASLHLCKWTDNGSLIIMTAYGWGELQEYLHENYPPIKNADLYRYINGNSTEIPLDSAGRIVVPANFMKHAGLTNSAVIVGCGPRAEIWSPERWEKLQEESDPAALMKKLTEGV